MSLECAHLGWHRHLPPDGPIPQLGKLGAPDGNTLARSMRWNRKVLSRDIHLDIPPYMTTLYLRRAPPKPIRRPH